mmetsp:Transcript_62347/g.185737  ORF Transcript_62347/g.185737 Transcript_62347/m.185737 type:complete len:252 (+) Transcript_62347:91-846(+)
MGAACLTAAPAAAAPARAVGRPGCLRAQVDDPARCALVWMHGLGDTEEKWAQTIRTQVLPLLEETAGPCKLVTPLAPRGPISAHEGRWTTRWFDMEKLPLAAGNNPPELGCSLEDAEVSVERIHGIIDELVRQGIPADKIAVGGFSQGGAMAVLSALTYPKRLAGIIVFSGIVFFADRITELMTEHSKGYEVFWGHGLRDDILDVSLQAAGVNALTEAGLHVTAKQYGAAHSSTPDEMEDAAVFLNGLLAP